MWPGRARPARGWSASLQALDDRCRNDAARVGRFQAGDYSRPNACAASCWSSTVRTSKRCGCWRWRWRAAGGSMTHARCSRSARRQPAVGRNARAARQLAQFARPFRGGGGRTTAARCARAGRAGDVRGARRYVTPARTRRRGVGGLRAGVGDPARLCGRAMQPRGGAEGSSRQEEALFAYDRALALQPDLPEALTNRAAVLFEFARYDEALASCDRSLQLKPGFHETWQNRGAALVRLERYDEALASYARALAIKPDFAEALQSRGRALAISSFMRKRTGTSSTPRPQSRAGVPSGQRLQAAADCCDLAGLMPISLASIVAAVRAGQRACDPLTFVAVADSRGGSAAMRADVGRLLLPASAGSAVERRAVWSRRGSAWRICRRISTSTRPAHLMAELFERHDRTRFEMTGMSWGPDTRSALRARLLNGVRTFHRRARQERPRSGAMAAERRSTSRWI